MAFHEIATGAPAWLNAPAAPDERRSSFETEAGRHWFVSTSPALFRLTGSSMGWHTIELAKPDYRAVLEGLAVGGGAAFERAGLRLAEIMWLTAVTATATAAGASRGPLPDLQGKSLQLKITLGGIKPPIWRRVIVPADLTLRDLAAVILEAMGWDDSHLHQFTIKGQSYGAGDEDGADNGDEDELLIGWLVEVKSKFTFEYDFGDGWEHTIVVEKELTLDLARPVVCVDGARACPPEDCGGPHGYANLLAALADKQHPDHRDLKAWLGGRFDAEAFDPAAVSKKLATMFVQPPTPTPKPRIRGRASR